VNKVDRWGGTALDVANNSEIESLLVQNGGKRNLLTKVELTLFDKKNSNFTNNQVRMFYAAYYGDLKTVQTLDALKVSVSLKDLDGRTPLHLAASEGNLDVVKYLIARGASVAQIDSRSNDPR